MNLATWKCSSSRHLSVSVLRLITNRKAWRWNTRFTVAPGKCIFCYALNKMCVDIVCWKKIKYSRRNEVGETQWACSWMGRVNRVKMTIAPTLMYRFNIISIKIPARISHTVRKCYKVCTGKQWACGARCMIPANANKEGAISLAPTTTQRRKRHF